MASEHTHHHHEHPSSGQAKDPVCGMTVDREHPRGGTYVHAGNTYSFCGPKCRERFSAAPGDFLAKTSTGCCGEPAATGVGEPPAVAQAEETAVDPVCGMTVKRAARMRTPATGSR